MWVTDGPTVRHILFHFHGSSKLHSGASSFWANDNDNGKSCIVTAIPLSHIYSWRWDSCRATTVVHHWFCGSHGGAASTDSDALRCGQRKCRSSPFLEVDRHGCKLTALRSLCSWFLDAFSHLYKRVCPSVRLSVHWSVRPSVTHEMKLLNSAIF